MFLTKLRRILQYNDLLGKFYLIVVGIILLLLTILRFSFIYMFLLIIFDIFLLFHNKNIFIMLLFLSIIIVCNITIRNINYNKVNYGDISIKGIVIRTEVKTKNYKITLKSQNLKYIFYAEERYNIGDEIIIKGTLNEGDINHSDKLFNYKKYLKEKNIKGIIEVKYVRVIKTKFTIYRLYDLCDKYYENKFSNESAGYLKALLIGNKNNMDEELSSNISKIGIGHLFVISGLHMNVLSLIVSKFLKLIKVNDKYHFFIISAFFISYLILTCGMISILRVLIIYILTYLNKKKKLNLTTFDIYI